jgi:hypothetical protein
LMVIWSLQIWRMQGSRRKPYLNGNDNWNHNNVPK